MKIGIISDTHNKWDDKYSTAFEGCEEIWHAGDVGSRTIITKLAKSGAIVRAVKGNCDSNQYPTVLDFKCEELNVHIQHIDDYKHVPPNTIFVNGHTHSPSFSEEEGVYYINPGSAAKDSKTVMIIEVERSKVTDVRLIKLSSL